MSERPCVLFVTPCTVSGYAGNIARFQQTISLLSLDHKVEFLSLVEPTSGHVGKLASWGASECSLPRFLQAFLRFTYKSVYVLNRLFVEVGFTSAYHFGAFDIVGRAILFFYPIRLRYHLIFTNYVWTARFWSKSSITTIIDLHDIHANRHKRIGSKAWVSLNPKDEHERINDADVCLAISWAEFQTLRKSYKEHQIRFMPYWPIEKPKSFGQRDAVAVFLASNNEVNSAALENLRLSGVVEILLDLGVRINVCGAICSSSKAKVFQQKFPESVNLLGIVDDLSNVLNSASFGINMAGPSTGLKIKTVDYLHAGLKVIATTHSSDPWLELVCPDNLFILTDGPLSELDKKHVRSWLLAALVDQNADTPKKPSDDAFHYWEQALSKKPVTVKRER